MLPKNLACFLLVLFLVSPGFAEDLYVKNRLFKGQVSKTDGKLWVELTPFARAIKWKLKGDAQSGFLLSEDGEGELPGAGKVVVAGKEVASQDSGSTMVSLDEIAPLIGARVVPNRDLGTIDVAMVKKKGSVKSGPAGIGSSPYTLIEYSSPSSPICKDIQPAIRAAKEKYGNVQHILCNVDNGGQFVRYKKYKKTKNKSFPEVTLVNSSGEILMQLRGNHVIANTLLKELRKSVRKR